MRSALSIDSGPRPRAATARPRRSSPLFHGERRRAGIPISYGYATVVQGCSPPMSAKSPSRRRVLVVDDEPMVTDWLKMVIEQAERVPGYEVRAAAIGSRGIEIFRAWRPDVVLLDLVLPD